MILADAAESPTQYGKQNRSSGHQSREGIQKEYLEIRLEPTDDPPQGFFDGIADLFFWDGLLRKIDGAGTFCRIN